MQEQVKSNGKETQTLADHDAITSANADANARSNTNGSMIENTDASAKVEYTCNNECKLKCS